MQKELLRTSKLSQMDYVVLSSAGARVIKLVLNGVTVIQAKQPYEQLGSGSYLMYPWVNRLDKPQPPYQPQFRDGNGLPLHGVAVNACMEITSQNVQNGIKITAKPIKRVPAELPDFTQIFTLQPKKFTVHFYVQGQSQLPICFGYHPYLQINNEDLVNLQIQTNIKTNIKLDQKSLLPIVPFIQNNFVISTTQKYDSLFKHLQAGDTYFILKNQNVVVQIRSPEMKYWQIYTPPDGKRIAVEPMTFMSNLYTLYSQQKYGKLPKQATFTITVS